MPIKKKYATHWKDFNSPMMRNEIWVRFCQIWHDRFDLPFVPFGICSEKNAIKYFEDQPGSLKLQHILVDRVLENPQLLKDWIRQSQEWGKEMNRYTESVQKADLRAWSVAKMIQVYDQFADFQAREYAIGILLVALDTSFGLYSLDDVIQQLIAKGLPEKNRKRAYEVFTRPFRDSFSRQQECELLKKHSTADIRRHAKKWAWVYYVYAGPSWTESDFAALVRDWSGKKVRPQSLLARWEKERKELLSERAVLLKRMNLSAKEKKLLSLAGDIVWSKPRRKDYQSKSYWHMETFFREVARRLEISLREARSLPQEMLFRALQTGKINQKKIEELYQYHLVLPTKTGVRIFAGDRAREFFSKYVYEEKVEVQGSEFCGTSACSGKATGVVRIINTPDDMAKMNQGDVLVSVATTPSIVSAMRKASAILTDEGGLTCHAAIVSRELNIPCVVGLHLITSAVKDGDSVNVNAETGVVTIC